MKVTVHVPDDMIDSARDRLPPPELGVLEAIALQAILSFLTGLAAKPRTGTPRDPDVSD